MKSFPRIFLPLRNMKERILKGYVLTEESMLCEHFLRCHTDVPVEVTLDYLSSSNISIVTDTEHSKCFTTWSNN